MRQGFWLQADATLRGERGRGEVVALGRSVRELLTLVLVFGAVYGAAMGSFGGVWGGRSLQVVYSGLKVPLLLMVTFGLSLPSFFIFNTLFGLRTDFGQALRALLASQAGLTILLASLAPFTLLWNVATTGGHQEAILFNAAMFGIATLSAQRLLTRYYRPLLEQDARHRVMLRIWGITYTFVGVQMGWILRPFVGDPSRPVAFFREDAWGNAYVVILELIRHVFLR